MKLKYCNSRPIGFNLKVKYKSTLPKLTPEGTTFDTRIDKVSFHFRTTICGCFLFALGIVGKKKIEDNMQLKK